jgi:hypothetical protein
MVPSCSCAFAETFRCNPDPGHRRSADAAFLVLLNGAEAESPHRAFSSSSYWNTPLPVNAPVDRKSARISFLRRMATTNFIHFAGAGSTGRWGNPIY